jgi:NAD(P)H-dependent FMN reductase
MGASNGNFGTTLSQAAWLPVLRTLQMLPFFGPKMLVSNAQKVFDDKGEMIDEKVRDKLGAFLKAYAAFLERVCGAGHA